MYQYATHYPLAKSKIYIENPLDAVPYLKKCVDYTNLYRKGKGLKPLNKHEIADGQRLIRMDFEENPKARELLGNPVELTLDNLLDSTGE